MGASTARKASFTALTLILTPLAGWADNARDWQNTPTDLNMNVTVNEALLAGLRLTRLTC